MGHTLILFQKEHLKKNIAKLGKKKKVINFSFPYAAISKKASKPSVK